MKIKINKTQWEFIGKQSGWADQIKTAQTKRSVNYYSYKQNPDGGLVNGSFIREKNGKFVKYTNGDFIGYVDRIPDDMTLVDPELAKNLIPKSLWN